MGGFASDPSFREFQRRRAGQLRFDPAPQPYAPAVGAPAADLLEGLLGGWVHTIPAPAEWPAGPDGAAGAVVPPEDEAGAVVTADGRLPGLWILAFRGGGDHGRIDCWVCPSEEAAWRAAGDVARLASSDPVVQEAAAEGRWRDAVAEFNLASSREDHGFRRLEVTFATFDRGAPG